MKLLILFIPFLLLGQTIEVKTAWDLFKDTPWKDFIVIEEDKFQDENNNLFDLIHVESDTLVDTLTTKVLSNNPYRHLDLYWSAVSDSADTTDSGGALDDTLNTTLEMGLFRGYGTVEGTEVDSSGYEWKILWHCLSQDTSVYIAIKDSSWWTDKKTTQYKFRCREVGGTKQRNEYYFTLFEISY